MAGRWLVACDGPRCLGTFTGLACGYAIAFVPVVAIRAVRYGRITARSRTCIARCTGCRVAGRWLVACNGPRCLGALTGLARGYAITLVSIVAVRAISFVAPLTAVICITVLTGICRIPGAITIKCPVYTAAWSACPIMAEPAVTSLGLVGR